MFMQKYAFLLESPNVFKEICISSRGFNTKSSNFHKNLILLQQLFCAEFLQPFCAFAAIDVQNKRAMPQIIFFILTYYCSVS